MSYNYGSPITGTLTGTTATLALPMLSFPATFVLNSSAVGRAIQLSFDNGTTFYAAVTPTLSETGQIVYALPYPATTVKFTGATNDTYAIL